MSEDTRIGLTGTAINILTRIGNHWGIGDDEVARLAGLTRMGYLMRRTGDDETPFSEPVIHRITTLGVIDRNVSSRKDGIDPHFWATTSRMEDPFRGRTPVDTMITEGMPTILAIQKALESGDLGMIAAPMEVHATPMRM